MAFVLLPYVLKLFSRVTQNDHSSCDLLAKFMKLLVSLFNLLIEGLIFDFQLLKIDQMKTIGKLLFLLKDLFLVSKTIS